MHAFPTGKPAAAAGFIRILRPEDGQGKPYPLVHLRLDPKR